MIYICEREPAVAALGCPSGLAQSEPADCFGGRSNDYQSILEIIFEAAVAAAAAGETEGR